MSDKTKLPDQIVPPVRDLMSERECAALLGKSPQALRLLRFRRSASCPPHIRRGRTIYYSRKKIEAWLKDGEIDPSDEPGR